MNMSRQYSGGKTQLKECMVGNQGKCLLVLTFPKQPSPKEGRKDGEENVHAGPRNQTQDLSYMQDKSQQLLTAVVAFDTPFSGLLWVGLGICTITTCAKILYGWS